MEGHSSQVWQRAFLLKRYPSGTSLCLSQFTSCSVEIHSLCTFRWQCFLWVSRSHPGRESAPPPWVLSRVFNPIYKESSPKSINSPCVVLCSSALCQRRVLAIALPYWAKDSLCLICHQGWWFVVVAGVCVCVASQVVRDSVSKSQFTTFFGVNPGTIGSSEKWTEIETEVTPVKGKGRQQDWAGVVNR